MRKLIISLLLAGAAASPALAQDHGRWHNDDAQSNNQQSQDDRSQAREERQQMREEMRAERFNGGGNAERMQEARQQQAARQFEMSRQAEQQQAEQQRAARQLEQGRRWDRPRVEDRGNVTPQQVVDQQQVERNYRGHRGDRGGFAGTGQQVDRSQREGWSRDRSGWSHDRDGDFRQRDAGEQQRYRDRSRWAGGGWNRDWRNDRRYDWRSYRNQHRSVFRIGVYLDPFGYGYRPFDIGYNLTPRYYGQRYWIDPSLYSLPFPPPGTTWVRYWNDAVLVDLYSGQVVDVIHNFFW